LSVNRSDSHSKFQFKFDFSKETHLSEENQGLIGATINYSHRARPEFNTLRVKTLRLFWPFPW